MHQQIGRCIVAVFLNLLASFVLGPPSDLFVGFTSDVYVVQEFQSTGIVSIPVVYHGNSRLNGSVTCVVSLGTADASDVYITPPQVLDFSHNETVKECLIIIVDDDEWEKEETLIVSLQVPSSPSINVTRSTATVFIEDSEDAPMVEFEREEYTIDEPLSNNEVDAVHVCLTVVCTYQRDLCTNVSVTYTVLPGTARKGVGYEESLIERDNIVYFSGDSRRERICVRVLADHGSQHNTWFNVELSSDNQTAIVGTAHRARVVIRNTLLSGAYFPDNPVVISAVFEKQLRDKPRLIRQEFELYHDQPLMCVTACDTFFPSDRYQHQCRKQQIDTSRTKYTWEVSHDRTSFEELNLDTALTSTRTSVLESVYFKQGLYVRCRVSAVDYSNVEGYSRTSKVMLLNATYTTCRQQHGTNSTLKAQISSYSSYSGRRKDFVLLDVVLPHLPNTFPILATHWPPTHHIESLLTSPVSRADLLCSTLTSSDDFGLLDQGPVIESSIRPLKTHKLYRHYDPSDCTWKFQAWVRVSTLTDNCGATFAPNSSNLTLSFRVIYVHVTNNSATVHGNTSVESHLTSSLETTADSHKQQLPFDYKASEELLVRPVAIEVDRVSLEAAVFVYTYLRKTRLSIHSMVASISGRTDGIPVSPVSTSLSNGTVEQAWSSTIILENTTATSLQLTFFGCSYSGECRDYVQPIEIPFSLHNASLSWNVSGWAKVNKSNEGNNVIVAGVSLDPVLALRQNYFIQVVSLTACYTSNMYSPHTSCRDTESESDNIEIPLLNKQYNDTVLVKHLSSKELSIVFTLNRDLSQPWYLHITCAIECENEPLYQLTQDITIPLPVMDSEGTVTSTIAPVSSSHQPLTDPTTVNSTPAEMETLPLYAMVLILIFLTVLVSVCSVTIVLFIITVRQRWILKREKRKDEERAKQEREDQEAKKEAERKSSKSVHRYYRSRRSKLYQNHSTLQTLLHKVSELPTTEDKSKRCTRQPCPNSVPDQNNEPSTNRTNTIPTSTNAHKNRTLMSMMRPISCTPPSTPKFCINKKPDSEDETKATITSSTSNSSAKKEKASAGWYDRYQMRQKSLEAYAQLYLAAGANTPEPGTTATTTL